MADTYSQIYFHIVFAVQGRKNIISKNWRDELYKYITGVVSNKNQKLLIINGMPDHIHILIRTGPNFNLSDLLRDVKSSSSKWINERKFVTGKFSWQKGFGAFSVSHSGLENVINYIKNQERHHKSISFREEYVDFLEANEVDFKLEYVFTE